MKRTPPVASVAAAALAVLAVLAGCGGGEPDRAKVMAPFVSTDVPRRFADYATTTGELADAVAAWCAGGEAPTALVERAQTEWYATKPFWTGPVMDRRSQFIMNFRVDPEGIDALLASDDAVDADTLRDYIGTDKRGLGALEYLVGSAADPRRCDYATGMVGLIDTEANAVAGEWATYGPALVTDQMSANDALREIVSNAVFALREIEKDASPAIEQGLLDGARAALVGDAEHPAISSLLDESTVTELKSEFDAGDAEAAELTVSTEVVSQLNVSLNFSDADGDG